MENTMESVTVVEVVQKNDAVEDHELAARCATTTLLITGACVADVESLARRIHAASARAAFPFVHMSAAALPIEVTRFRETCADFLEAATGGSLFLTEVED